MWFPFRKAVYIKKKVHLVYHLKMIWMRLSLTAFLCNYRRVCMHCCFWCSSFTYFLCCVETCWSTLCCGSKGGKKLFIEERFISMEILFFNRHPNYYYVKDVLPDRPHAGWVWKVLSPLTKLMKAEPTPESVVSMDLSATLWNKFYVDSQLGGWDSSDVN